MSDNFQRFIDGLYDKIITVIGKPIIDRKVPAFDLKSLDRQTSVRDQVLITSFQKPLLALTVKEVGVLLDRLNLGIYKSIFHDHQIDGPSLNSCECLDHVKEMGIGLTVKAKILFDKIIVYQREGVPMDVLIEEENGVKNEPDIGLKADTSFIKKSDSRQMNQYQGGQGHLAYEDPVKSTWNCQRCNTKNFEFDYCISCATRRSLG